MKKRFLCILLALLMVAALLPVSAFAANVASGKCGDNLTWELDSAGKLTISGTGAMYDFYHPLDDPPDPEETGNYDYHSVPWYDEHASDIKRVVLGDGVTYVGDFAFALCKQLTDVSVGASLQKFSVYAFLECRSLKSFTVASANSLYTADSGILFSKDKTVLVRYPCAKEGTSYSVPSTVKTIGVRAFDTCNMLTDVTLGNVETIEEYAFYDCISITGMKLGSSLKYIANDAFDYCVKLKSLNLPASLTFIGESAFWKCTDLETIIIPSGIKKISGNTFRQCEKLATIMIPASVEIIDFLAFDGCSNLKDVYYGGTKAQWDLIDIYDMGNDELFKAEKHFSWSAHEGWEKISAGKWVYYENGALKTGWLRDGSKWYYLGTDGVMVTGWKSVGGKWYYMNTSGVMQTGWTKVGTKWYYMNTSGVMQTGWVKSGGKWYYMESSGAMLTGWQKINGKWYYLGADGAMATGWQKISNKWYYLGTDGAMVTGWQKISGVWYFFESGGAMKTGWYKENGKWYYLKSSGAMACNESVTVSGKSYSFNSSGVCTNP